MSWAFANITCDYFNILSKPDQEASHSESIPAINDSKDSRNCGLDGILADYLKHLSDSVIPLLSMCVNSLFVLVLLPESMQSVVLVPIVKNKTAIICNKNNYNIPIALANVVSKVFETIIYDRIAYSLSTCNN